MTVQNNTKCEHELQTVNPAYSVTDNMMCSGHDDHRGRDTCQVGLRTAVTKNPCTDTCQVGSRQSMTIPRMHSCQFSMTIESYFIELS